MEKSIRPTKKQKELLSFIADFIAEHGYSPSYREIMVGKGYNSVATVALHVNSLIKRGHLRKRDRSARSLELVDDVNENLPSKVSEDEAKWLVKNVENYFIGAESNQELTQADVDNLFVLVGALKVLGLQAAVTSFMPRLTTLKSRLQ
jgi:SOS-response transcriptional repressor LexA